jgi:hypothetical protein
LTAVNGNFSADVNIGGNLFIAGQAFEVDTTHTTTTDTTFTLNTGEIGNGITAGSAGLLIDRGTASQARLVFDEAAGGWKVGTAALSGLIATQPWVTANTVPTAHAGSGGSAHSLATASNAGFMSSADKSKLDTMVTGISQTAADARYLQLTGGTVTNLTVTNTIQGSVSGTATNVTGVVALAKGGTGIAATSNAQLVSALGAATLASPAFTGAPTAPTAALTDNSTTIATTAFVKGQGYAPLASPTFTGAPKAPTAAVADNSTTIATTAYVQSQGYLKTSGTVANATNASTAASVPWSGVTSKPTTLAGYGITDKVALVTATVNQVPYSNGSAYVGNPEFTFTTGIGAGPGAGYSVSNLNIGTAGGLQVNMNLGGSVMGQFGLPTSATIATGQTLALNAIRNDGLGSINLRVGGTDRLVTTNTGTTVYGTLTANTIVGNITGNVTGNVTGTAGSVTFANVTGKPTTFAGYGVTAGSLTSLTVTNPISGSITGSAGSVAWTNITSRPTTLAGYGITDASSSVAVQPISRGGTNATTAADALVSLGAAPRVDAALSGTPTAPTAATATSTTQIATTAFVKNQNYVGAATTGQAPTGVIPVYDGNGKLANFGNFSLDALRSGGGPGGNWGSTTLNIGAANGYASTINMYSSYSQSTIYTNAGLYINAGGGFVQLQSQGTTMAQVDATGLRVPSGNLTVTNNITASGTITATGGFQGNFTGTVTGNITGTAAGLSATLPINRGGTGATTAAAGLAALNGLPLTGGALSGALTVTGAVQATGLITAGTGVSGGFQNASYAAGRNNIWRFSDSATYGISYFQGSGGKRGGDSIGIHFGNATAAGSNFSFNSIDGSFDATSFNGAGTGLTGTAANLTAGTANAVAWSGITSKPTTVAGYGITDAVGSTNPTFTGTVTAGTFSGAGTSLTGTAASLTVGNATKLATARTISGVSFDGTANITIPVAGVTGAAPLASPALTGTPTAPTVATADSSTSIATTAFVKNQAYAPLAAPAFTGVPTAPTATAGTNTTQLATTAFVTAAVSAGGGSGAVSSVAGRTGAVVLAQADISGLTTASSPSFTAVSTTGKVTAGTGINSTLIGNARNPVWSFVSNDNVGISYFQGSSSTNPGLADTVGIHFAGATAASSLHQFNQDGTARHTGALTASNFIGAGTGLTGTASSLTAGIASAVAWSGITSKPTTLAGFGITDAATLASPVLTGVPTAPTATAGTNTTQLATTAFVTAAVSGSGTLPAQAGNGGKFLTTDGTVLSWATVSGGGASVGGSTTQVQFNNAGVLSGSAALNIITDTAGSQVVRIGSVTTSTATATPTQLQADGSYPNTGTPTNQQLKLEVYRNSTSTTERSGLTTDNNRGLWFHTGDSAIAGTGNHVFATANVERLRVNSAGLTVTGTSGGITMAAASNTIAAVGNVIKMGTLGVAGVATPTNIWFDGSFANTGTPTNQQLKLSLYRNTATENFGFSISNTSILGYHAGDSTVPSVGGHRFLVADVQKMLITPTLTTSNNTLTVPTGNINVTAGNVNIGSAVNEYVASSNGAQLNVYSAAVHSAIIKVSGSAQNSGMIAFGDYAGQTYNAAVWRGAQNSLSTGGNALNLNGTSGINFAVNGGAGGGTLVQTLDTALNTRFANNVYVGNATTTPTATLGTQLTVKGNADRASVSAQSIDGTGHITMTASSLGTDTNAYLAVPTTQALMIYSGSAAIGGGQQRAMFDKDSRFYLGNVADASAQVVIYGTAATRAASDNYMRISDGTTATLILGKLTGVAIPRINSEQSNLSLGINSTTETVRLHSSGWTIFGNGEATASVTAYGIRSPNVTGGDATGVNFNIQAGNGTGAGGSGSIIFNTAPPAGSSSSANSMVERVRIDPTGSLNIGYAGVNSAGGRLLVVGTTIANATVKIAGPSGNTGGLFFGDGTITQETVGLGRSNTAGLRTTGGNSLALYGCDAVSFQGNGSAVPGQVETMRITLNEVIIGGGELTAAPSSQIIRAPSSAGTNIVGPDLKLGGGRGTGTAGGGSIIFQTAGTTTSGGGLNVLNERARIDQLGNLNIGTSTTVSSAKLQVVSTTQGFLPPVMTTAQKNAIVSPATGLVVFDSTLGKLCVCVAGTWQTIQSA